MADRIAAIQSATSRVPDLNTRFRDIAIAYADLETTLKNLGVAELSPSDHAKVTAFGDIFISQLREYGFESYKPDEIAISHQSYQPIHNGYPLGLVSASDMIRMVWAYLLGLLETARTTTTNHLGLLLLDEPKQHNVKGASYDTLLARAATSGAAGQQVIIATSQLSDDVTAMLRSCGCRFKDFESRIIQPK